MRAIILAGGFGTRLQSVLGQVPKPMAPIADKPFLAHLLHYLKKQGMTEIVLSLHYLREQFAAYFGQEYLGMKIHYAIEEEPLGTGGAMAFALAQLPNDEPVFVLNGDTFVKLNYRAMYAAHIDKHARLTFALREVLDCSRYGRVITDQEKITAFAEKGQGGRGLINAGVYLLSPNLFHGYQVPKKFSFETEFINVYFTSLRPSYYLANDYFIDIGIPEDYARAQRELSML